jgi:Bacterial regulatory proteins, tetR family
MAAPRTSAQPRPRTIRGLDADQRRAQRREQLLAAAFELFARDGYAKASIEEICQTAYVGNKAFYDLFDSKIAMWRCCARSPNASKIKWHKRCRSRPTPTRRNLCAGCCPRSRTPWSMTRASQW